MYIEITEVRAVPIIITVTLQFATVCWIQSNFHKISLLYQLAISLKRSHFLFWQLLLKTPNNGHLSRMTTTIMISQQP